MICKDFIVFDKVNNKIFIVVFSSNTDEGYDESSKKIQKVRNNILMSQKRIDSTNQVIFAAASLTLFQESTKLG